MAQRPQGPPLTHYELFMMVVEFTSSIFLSLHAPEGSHFTVQDAAEDHNGPRALRLDTRSVRRSTTDVFDDDDDDEYTKSKPYLLLKEFLYLNTCGDVVFRVPDGVSFAVVEHGRTVSFLWVQLQASLEGRAIPRFRIGQLDENDVVMGLDEPLNDVSGPATSPPLSREAQRKLIKADPTWKAPTSAYPRGSIDLGSLTHLRRQQIMATRSG